jgi:hypothetical protein
MTTRVAVYYAPATSDPLWTAGNIWLGRDPQSGRRIPGPYDAITEEPRLYGFHATLKPPMRPVHSWSALMEDATALAARIAPFDLPPLAVMDLGGFLALRETAPCPALHALADACVVDLDPHRTPPDAAELAKRRRGGLPPEQDAMLVDWGYPHVLTTWRFHMTLTRRLTADERAELQPVAESHFAASLAIARRVEEICLYTQLAPGSPFLLAERLPLNG